MSTFKKHDMSLSRSIGAFRVSTAIRIAASAATAVGPVFDLREFDFVSDELRRHTLPVNLIGQSAQSFCCGTCHCQSTSYVPYLSLLPSHLDANGYLH